MQTATNWNSGPGSHHPPFHLRVMSRTLTGSLFPGLTVSAFIAFSMTANPVIAQQANDSAATLTLHFGKSTTIDAALGASMGQLDAANAMTLPNCRQERRRPIAVSDLAQTIECDISVMAMPNGLESNAAFTKAVDAKTAAPKTFVSLQLENDFFAGSGDRYYTHGTQISMLKVAALPAWMEAVSSWFPLYQQGNQLNLVNYTLGQKIFTSDDTSAKAIVPGDRPYAGYLYGSVAVLSQISNAGNVDSANMVEISLGVVGPSAMGAQVQGGFHDLIGIDSPQGWDNQLHDEAALGLSYTRIWRRIQPVSGDLEFGVAPQASIALGNVYTYGAAGAMLRLGRNLKRDLSPPNIRPGFPGLAYFQGGSERSWYVFLGFEGRYVVRDIFLDGNTFEDSARVEKLPLVGDMQFGFVYQLDRVRIGISSMTRTREFSTQQQHANYGAVNFSFHY